MLRRAGRASSPRRARRGAALVELVMVLPMLSFILVASTDFARGFHDLVTITDCSRNGSLYASQNSTLSASALAAGTSAAALAGSGGMSTTATVTSTTGSLGTQNNYVDVTVANPFQTLASYPGIPSSMTISRKIRMRVLPTAYRMQ